MHSPIGIKGKGSNMVILRGGTHLGQGFYILILFDMGQLIAEIRTDLCLQRGDECY